MKICIAIEDQEWNEITHKKVHQDIYIQDNLNQILQGRKV